MRLALVHQRLEVLDMLFIGLIYVIRALRIFFACVARLFVARKMNVKERQRWHERTLSACRNPTSRSESAAARSALIARSSAARAACWCVSAVARASTSRVCASASSASHRRSAARSAPCSSRRRACSSRSADRLCVMETGVVAGVSGTAFLALKN